MATEATAAVQPMEVEKVVVENAEEKSASKEKNPVEDGGAAPAPEAEVCPKRMVAPVKVVLRLDNGTLAKFACETKKVELLSPEAAFEAGALREADLLRIQSYLCEVHAKLPSEGPLKSVSLMSSKRSYDTVLDVGPGGAAGAKRAKSLLAMAGPAGGGSTFRRFGVSALCVVGRLRALVLCVLCGDGVIVDSTCFFRRGCSEIRGAALTVSNDNRTTAPNTSHQVGVAAGSHDLPRVANSIFRFLKKNILKADEFIFVDPVDASNPNLSDYYDIVPHKEPISFSVMERKLDNNEYESPLELFQDFFKMCDNCNAYNMVAHPVGWLVGVLAIRMEHAFYKSWSKSPFAKYVDPDRKPRRIPKDSENPNPPIKPQKPARSSSMPRQASRTQFGGGHQAKVWMTAEMENDLVSALNTPEILEENMEAVVGILQAANEMGTDEDGEPSLDLEKVSAPTKRKLYDLVVQKPATSGGANPTTSGFQIEDDDDFEDE